MKNYRINQQKFNKKVAMLKMRRLPKMKFRISGILTKSPLKNVDLFHKEASPALDRLPWALNNPIAGRTPREALRNARKAGFKWMHLSSQEGDWNLEHWNQHVEEMDPSDLVGRMGAYYNTLEDYFGWAEGLRNRWMSM